MRTTLDLDDDVLLAAKERARRLRKSVGAVVSELARQSLTRSAASEVGESESFYGFAPFGQGGSLVSNELVERLREEDPE